MSKPYEFQSPHGRRNEDLRDELPDVPFELRDWYVDEGQVAERPEQADIINELRSIVGELKRLREWQDVYVGADAFFAWIPEQPQVMVSPDVFLLDGPPDLVRVSSFQTWLPGHRPPRWAVEIVSHDWRKDYQHNPIKYSQLGCAELVLFDPAAARGDIRNRARVAISVFRRRSEGGALERVYAGPGPAWSEQLGCWMRTGMSGYFTTLRLSEDEEGRSLIPSSREARRAAERERDDALRARDELEARVRDLEKKLRQK